MSLHEIEETLRELQSRHSGLDEGLLVTLLRGGGWEEKNIQEAILLFRSGGVSDVKTTVLAKTGTVGVFPITQSDPVFEPQVDEKHLLLEHNEENVFPVVLHNVPPPEPQSLIEDHSKEALPTKEDLPHNLPLRPFETSDHIWPFSRYRDVFYGDIEPTIVTEKKEVEKAEIPATPSPVAIPVASASVVPAEKEIAKTELPPTVVIEKQIVRVYSAKNDEGLVIMACVMLLAVILLLGYMYSNGRL